MADDDTKILDPARTRATRLRTAVIRTAGSGGTQGVPVWLTRLVAVGLVLAAVNLRPAITSLGALLEEVRGGLGMSGSVAGLLTSVPPLCFAVFGIAAPRLARRWGVGAVVCAGMVAIATGLLIRPFTGGAAGFLAASGLGLAGIAVSNVLMPVIVKRWFPDRVGSMTGLYSMGLSLGTSLAAAATVPLTDTLGGSWRIGLAVWAVPAVLAVVPWLPLVVRERRTAAPVRARQDAAAPGAAGRDDPASERAGRDTHTGERDTAERARQEAPAASVEGEGGRLRECAAERRDASGVRMTRSRTAWALACFFGFQATGAYITMGWMPQIFRDAGVPASTSGVLLAVTMGLGVPLSFALPRLAARMRNQGPLSVVLGLCGLSGYAGLYLAPASGAWLWALLLGISTCAFPLVLTLIGLRTRTGAAVVRLSAFVQSTGYLISIPGPLLIGVLYQHTGGWGLPLVLMACLMVPQMVLGVIAGRNRFVEDECEERR
ncbi:CynX/NimT family MFS transporter [Streptomyces sp. 8N706]|uniref:CynX/NimT family MFS transporter n=1 Tax=Streptomyces sp. 8N706 TaxID=3457416 RepID=UPI003FCFD702